MCVSARIERRGRPVEWPEKFGELRRLLGWRPPQEAYATWPARDRECLCHIDWPRLQRLSGWRRQETPRDDDPWRVWLTDATPRPNSRARGAVGGGGVA